MRRFPRTSRSAALAALMLSAGLGLAGPAAAAGDYSFSTAADFVRDCGVSSPPEECLNAVLYVEQVVDSGDNRNSTCDGGPDELLRSASNAELNDKLAQRLARVVPWLRAHPEYADKSYGDGVWAALKGAYCS